MNTMTRFAIISTLAVGVWTTHAPPARAGLLFEQIPSLGNGGVSDTLYLENRWQICADNFRFTTDLPVAHVTWWGFYGGGLGMPIQPPTADETIRLRFYDARPSDDSPGDVLYEEFLLNPQRIATGRHVAQTGQPAEYRFDVNLQFSFSALADTMYWLEIVQIGLNESMFRWSFSTTYIEGLDGSAFVNLNVPDWQIVPTNLAFQLYDVPEPSTVMLSNFGFIVVSGRRCVRSIKPRGDYALGMIRTSNLPDAPENGDSQPCPDTHHNLQRIAFPSNCSLFSR